MNFDKNYRWPRVAPVIGTPPHELRDLVHSFWLVDESGPTQGLMPADAQIGMVFNLGPNFALDSYAVRPSEGCLDAANAAFTSWQAPFGARAVGLRFQIAGARRVLDLCPANFVGRRIATDAVVDTERVCKRLRACRSHTDLFLVLAEFVAQWRHCEKRAAPPSDGVMRALAIMHQSSGTAPIRDVARLAGMSERNLLRRCREQLGIAPKALARVLRVSAARKLLRVAPKSNLTALAHELGFADQAHFSHDFRRVRGLSPSAYR